jgi:putative transposase
MIITYKYRLKDNNAKKALLKYALVVNTVWNYCVETQRKIQSIWELGQNVKWPNHYDFCYLTHGVSKKLGIHGQTIQSVCEQFVRSRNTHKKCSKFRKSTGSKRSLGWIPFQEQSRQITNSSVTYLGKTYRFFGAKKRPLPSNAKGGCFVEDSKGKWYVCFYIEVQFLPKGTNEIGVDLGLKTLVATSNGEKFEPLQSYRKLEQKLATNQRAGNKKRVKAINVKIKNQRKDYLHKISSKLASDNKLIVVGNISSSKLSKTNMAKSVLDASWYMLRRFLAYKVSRHQGTYIEINENFTTQTCSQCGNCTTEGRPKGIAGLGIRSWKCENCGTNHDRDINAALNILKIGLSIQPRVDGSL